MGIYESNRTDAQDNATVSIGESASTNLAQVSLKLNGKYGLETVSEVNHVPHSFENFSGAKYYTEDMLGVARNATITSTFTDIFSYTGAGYLINYTATFETGDTDWYSRIVIDGSYYPLFGTTGIFHPDMKGAALYNIFSQSSALAVNLGLGNDTIYFNPSYPIRFATSLKIQARHATGKRYRAGFVTLIKD